MAKLTRRGLLKRTSVGVATVGVLGAGIATVPHLAALAQAPAASATNISVTANPGPMVVYVRDLTTAEVGVLVGEDEIILHDPVIVTRLLKAIGQ